MRQLSLTTISTLAALASALATNDAKADDYYYVPPGAYAARVYYGPPVYSYEPVIAPAPVIVRRPVASVYAGDYYAPGYYSPGWYGSYYSPPVAYGYTTWRYNPWSREYKYRVYTPYGVRKYEVEFERDGDIEVDFDD
jgi:hypothetical protein